MLIAALTVTLIWLLLLVYGRYVNGIPSKEIIKYVVLTKAELKQRLRATTTEGELSSSKASPPRTKPVKLPSPLIYIPGYALYELAKLEQRAITMIHMLHNYMMQLHRYQWSFEGTVFLLNEMIGLALLILVVGSWLAYAMEEWAINGICLVVAVVLIINLLQSTKQMLDKRRKAMLMELPKLLTRITLLVGAGETVVQAFTKCVLQKQESKHPLYVEWREAVHQLNNGVSFSVAVERLNRNCSLQQMSLLTTYLLLSYRKGGEHFISSVQELNLSLWETRKQLARTKGEEGSSKMIFPLVGILLMVMILIVAPAIMMMNNM